MEQLILTVYVVVAGATLCIALSMLGSKDGRVPTPLRLLASFALTLPAQTFLAAAAMLLYVDIIRPDPERLPHVVLACGSLLVCIGAAYAAGICKTSSPLRSRILGIGGVLAICGLALAALLGAAYG